MNPAEAKLRELIDEYNAARRARNVLKSYQEIHISAKARDIAEFVRAHVDHIQIIESEQERAE